jgi:hypothetical protein
MPLGQLLPIERGPLVALLEVLAIGEGVALLHQGEARVGAALREHLRDGSAVAVSGLAFSVTVKPTGSSSWSACLACCP